jgi:hypothetical protein
MTTENEEQTAARDQAKWQIAPFAHLAFIHGGAYILDVNQGWCYGLEGIAVKIWEIIEPAGSRSLAEIVDVLAPQYEIEREKLREDVFEFLQCLRRSGLAHC